MSVLKIILFQLRNTDKGTGMSRLQIKPKVISKIYSFTLTPDLHQKTTYVIKRQLPWRWDIPRVFIHLSRFVFQKLIPFHVGNGWTKWQHLRFYRRLKLKMVFSNFIDSFIVLIYRPITKSLGTLARVYFFP